MEIWWAGIQTNSISLLAMIGLTAILLLGYNTYAGVRPNETWAGVVIDSVEEFGLSLVASGCILLLLGRITTTDPLREIVGKVVLEALLMSIGISIGTAQVTHQNADEEKGPGKRPKDLWGVLVVSACGAVVLATNIAVTDEVVVLALESSSIRLIGLIGVSFVLCGIILLFSDLLKTKATEDRPTGLLEMTFGVFLSYSVAFCSSALILYLFGRFDGVALQPCLAMIVVLTSAASLGAASGKLLIR